MAMQLRCDRDRGYDISRSLPYSVTAEAFKPLLCLVYYVLFLLLYGGL